MYGIRRGGFAMILAILVVLLVAGGGALILSNASRGSKAMGDNYLRAQAELLAQSATEFAVLRAQGFDTSGGNCLNRLDITVQDADGNPSYDVNVSMFYAFRGIKPPGGGTCQGVEGTGKDTTVLIDTTVTTRPSANLSTEPIRVHRRSVQKF